MEHVEALDRVRARPAGDPRHLAVDPDLGVVVDIDPQNPIAPEVSSCICSNAGIHLSTLCSLSNCKVYRTINRLRGRTADPDFRVVCREFSEHLGGRLVAEASQPGAVVVGDEGKEVGITFGVVEKAAVVAGAVLRHAV